MKIAGGKHPPAICLVGSELRWGKLVWLPDDMFREKAGDGRRNKIPLDVNAVVS